MKTRARFGLLVALLLSLGGQAAATDLLATAQMLFEPIPQSPPALKGNPSTEEKLTLGRMLFFDPRLSASHLISCNTCHNLGLAGVDLQETSIGHGWQKGPRNAPTVLNSVFNAAQFWDGRAADLAEQAKGPVQAAVEMNNTPQRVLTTLRSLPEYVKRFAQAFPGQKEPLTFDNVAKAIEVFEATLLTPDAPFDRFLRGDRKALAAREKEGLDLFINRGCSACHGGVNLGGSGYFPFGVLERPDASILPPEDKGRFQVTNTAGDQYVFKAPSLRNVALTAPYFHSGKVWSLQEAVALMGSAQLGVKLSGRERSQVTAFLQSLTGRQPTITYPLLPANGEKTPPPVL